MNTRSKTLRTLFITAALALVLARPAHAAVTVAPFSEYKIVGSSGSTLEKTLFTLDDPSPYLYMQLPKNGSATTTSTWTGPGTSSFIVGPITDTAQNRWIAFANWDTVTAGDWTVSSSYLFPNGNNGINTTAASFTVTPEPLAMTLFLLGGVPIAASLYRKRKKSVRV